MVWFIIGGLIAVIAIITLVIGFTAKDKEEKNPILVAGVIGLVLGVLVTLPSVFFTVDEGESKVMKSFGAVVGSTTSPGIHTKAPWSSTTTFDTKSNQLEYRGDSSITFNDKDNATAELDITIRYSIDPSQVESIYAEYQTQDNFINRQLDPDVRSVSRTTPAKYTTAQVYGEMRNQIGVDIQKTLTERWEKAGVRNVEVNVQGVRYSQNIIDANNNLAAERTKVEQAKAETTTAGEQAKKKVVEAEAQAKANDLLTKSLTPEVLKAKQIEALQTAAEKGQLIITDGNKTIVDATKK